MNILVNRAEYGDFEEILQKGPVLEFEFPCDQCTHKSSSKFNLKHHTQFVHQLDTKIRYGVKHSCSKCNYQASSHSGLQTHFKSLHTDVKYACDQCQHKASTKSSLKVHIKSSTNISGSDFPVLNVNIKQSLKVIYRCIFSRYTRILNTIARSATFKPQPKSSSKSIPCLIMKASNFVVNHATMKPQGVKP